jgi:hypothetical protein
MTDELAGSNAMQVPDDPPGALLIIGVLLGQHDGRAFLSDVAVDAIARGEVVVWRDEERNGWNVEVRRGR